MPVAFAPSRAVVAALIGTLAVYNTAQVSPQPSAAQPGTIRS
jgi:hypothetical protein